MRVNVPPLADRRRESRFFTTLARAMGFVVLLAYGRSFYLGGWSSSATLAAPADRILSLYGAVLTAWFVLLVLQTTLVRSGFMQLHRRVGLFGMFIAALVFAIGCYDALLQAGRAEVNSFGMAARDFLIVPLTDLLLFGVCVLAAYSARHGKKSHKRWIVLAAISVLGVMVAHLLPLSILSTAGYLLTYLFADVFLVALALWDLKSLGRLHPVTLWGGILLVGSQVTRLLLVETAAWEKFADWATRLV